MLIAERAPRFLLHPLSFLEVLSVTVPYLHQFSVLQSLCSKCRIRGLACGSYVFLGVSKRRFKSMSPEPEY
jgi:hypothetical protein